MKFKVKWKDDFLGIMWYQNNPASVYLDGETQLEMINKFLSGEDNDLDSEAEVVIVS